MPEFIHAPLEAAAARSWALSKYTNPQMIEAATVEEFHELPANVQQWHRERVAQLVAVTLDAAALVAGAYQGADSAAEALRSMAGTARRVTR